MQINVLFDSIDEAIVALSAVKEMGNAADVNGDDSGASKHVINVTQSWPEVNGKNAQDAHDSHEIYRQESFLPDESNVKEESLEDILERHGIRFHSGYTSWNVIGCDKTIRKIYSSIGYEKTDLLFDVVMGAWPKGHMRGVQRFDGAILKEIAAFIGLYFEYGIDKDMLIRHMSKAVTSTRPITPGDFKKMITTRPGEATLKLYNSGMWEGNRFPDITRRRKTA